MSRDARVRRRLKLRDLDTLLAVARRGSMAKAAVDLAVSQPAVSQAIADMEQMIGVRLFDRTARGIEPTVYGHAMLKAAGAALDDVGQGVKQIEFLLDPTAGELRIGATAPMLCGFLPAVLSRLIGRYPKVAHHVTEVSGPEKYHLLRERSVDLIIGRTDGRGIAAEFETSLLFEDRLFVVAGGQNSWTRRRKIRLADLIDETWVLPPANTTISAFVADAFRSAGLGAPRTVVECDSIQLQQALLNGNPILGILPQSVLDRESPQVPLKKIPVALPMSPPPVGITVLKKRTLNPIVTLFIDCAQETAAEFGMNCTPAEKRKKK